MALEEYTPPLEERIKDSLADRVMLNIAKDAWSVIPHTSARSRKGCDAPAVRVAEKMHQLEMIGLIGLRLSQQGQIKEAWLTDRGWQEVGDKPIWI